MTLVNNRLPEFLIVGAMKSATTTLFEDLATHPRLHEPVEKEPGNLCSDDVLSAEGRGKYARLFCEAEPNQLTFEASTYYTMRPDHEGVAQRAKSLLGESLKVIYLVREPTSRAISHHAHAHAAGDCGADINKEIRHFERLINYSKYYYQIEPWLTVFGESNVFILTQEYYVKHRREAVTALQSFLGLEPRADLIEATWIGNKRTTLVKDTAMSRVFRNSVLYKRGIRPFLSPSIRSNWKGFFMKKIARPVTEASPQTRAYIEAETQEDVSKLAPYVRLKEAGGWV